MQFNDYQKLARKTAIYPFTAKVIYPTLGLAGESGEVCEKIKKVLRDSGGDFKDTKFREDCKKELGDILWYISNLAYDLGLNLDDIAELNIEKLMDRMKRDKLHGSGDNR